MHGICFLTCPKCGRQIEEPFSRYSGPIAWIHRPKGRRCNARLIAIPAVQGHAHRVLMVPHNRSLESELTAALDDALDRERAA